MTRRSLITRAVAAGSVPLSLSGQEPLPLGEVFQVPGMRVFGMSGASGFSRDSKWLAVSSPSIFTTAPGRPAVKRDGVDRDTVSFGLLSLERREVVARHSLPGFIADPVFEDDRLIVASYSRAQAGMSVAEVQLKHTSDTRFHQRQIPVKERLVLHGASQEFYYCSLVQNDAWQITRFDKEWKNALVVAADPDSLSARPALRTRAALSPCGRFLAYSADGRLIIRHARDLSIHASFPKQGDVVHHHLAFDATGEYLGVSIGSYQSIMGREVIIISTVDSKILERLPFDAIEGLALSRGAKFVAGCSVTRGAVWMMRVALYDRKHQRVVGRSIHDHGSPSQGGGLRLDFSPGGVAFLKDDAWLVTSGPGIRVWAVPSSA